MLISQEQFLSFYADKRGLERENLGEDEIRMALAFYTSFYLVVTATLEHRTIEQDLEWRYKALGFEANIPTVSTGTVAVTIKQAATQELSLKAPFRVTQKNKSFEAATDLVIPIGQRDATFTVVANEEGSAGTPTLDTAVITKSAAWLIGSSIRFVSKVDGQDGLTDEQLQDRFRAFAFQPSALVKGVDHENNVERTFEDVGRAIARERTEVVYSGGVYTERLDVPGYLSIGVINKGGAPVSDAELEAIKDHLLLYTVGYGPNRLNIYPLVIQPIFATITVRRQPGIDPDLVKENIILELDKYLNWESWTGDTVYSGGIWAAVDKAAGITRLEEVTLSGRDRSGRPGSSQYYLRPWQLPTNGITDSLITVLEFDGSAI